MKLQFRLAYLFTLLWGISSITYGQEIKVRSGFVEDSIRVGDHARYYLTARYPRELNIVFPDSAFNYAPFEFEGKRYFPTETEDGKSYDSVVYSLSTFETDSLQSLTLPIFVLHDSDSTTFYSKGDTTILLDKLVAALPDTVDIKNLPLRINVAYQPVHKNFNYPIFIGIAYVLLVVFVVVWLIFRKRVKRYFHMRKMKKKYLRFSQEYSVSMEKLRADFTPLTAEHTVTIWKKYLEDLERAPFTKLTTRETLNILKDVSLEQNLRDIDRAIYGNRSAKVDPFEKLRTFADHKFQQRLQQVKHG